MKPSNPGMAITLCSFFTLSALAPVFCAADLASLDVVLLGACAMHRWREGSTVALVATACIAVLWARHFTGVWFVTPTAMWHLGQHLR